MTIQSETPPRYKGRKTGWGRRARCAGHAAADAGFPFASSMSKEQEDTVKVALGITLANWILAFSASTLSFILARSAIGFVLKRSRAKASNSEAHLTQIMVEVLSGTSNTLLLLGSILIGVGFLDLPERWLGRVSSLWFVVAALQAGLWANRAIALALSHYFLRIAAFVASLGVGGIAIALAVQNILGDVFASLSIAVDKPFEVGDFIVVGSMSGTVEHVGLKTTRIRSLSGEQIVMANAEMIGSTIKNYKRLQERRIVFEIGLTYDCSPEQVKEVPKKIEQIIRGQVKARFDRSHFRSFGQSALEFETVYIVMDPSYNVYMDVQQAINFELMEAFAALNVNFAFPSRTVYVASLPIEYRPIAKGESPPAPVQRNHPANTPS